MKKKLLSISMASVVALAAFAGCVDKKDDVDHNAVNHLDVFCFNAGYGVEWAEQQAKAFIQQDWVKEKYGEATYSFDYNDIDGYVGDRLRSGSAINQYDVMFDCGSVNHLLETKIGSDYVIENLSDLYAKEIPGEGVKYADKMHDFYLSQAKVRVGAEQTYMYTYWASGMSGIIYNATLLEKMGYQVPVTTDEFVSILADVKAKDGTHADYEHKYAIMASAATGYWRDVLPIFWAQYEGIEEYENFFNGISEGTYSKDVVKQEGRKEAVLTLEQILDGDKGYMTPSASIYDFKDSQTNFLMGMGLFIAEGDWFEYETSEISEGIKDYVLETKGYSYDFKMLKTPIISSIVNKTPSIQALATERGVTNDQALALVIKDVDAGNVTCSYPTVTPADYAIIVEARNVINSLGVNHKAVIPSYAAAKDMAKDFLLFCASDKGLEIYAKYTNGGALPFDYDLQTKAPTVYENISLLQKTRLDIIKSNNFGDVKILADYNAYPLCWKGGFAPWVTVFNFEVAFGSPTGNANKVKAIDVYNGDIAHWTDFKWNEVMAKANLG